MPRERYASNVSPKALTLFLTARLDNPRKRATSSSVAMTIVYRMREIISCNADNARTHSQVRAKDIMEKRGEIVSKLQHAQSADMDKCGCTITDVGIVDISDAPNNTAISDIAGKREAEMRESVAVGVIRVWNRKRTDTSSYPAEGNLGSRRIGLALGR